MTIEIAGMAHVKLTVNDLERAKEFYEKVLGYLGMRPVMKFHIRKRAKALQQAIPSFGRNFDEGMKKFRAGQLISAAKPLRKARELYLQIALPSKVGDQLNEALAEAAVAAGKEALLRDDLESAALYYRDAVRLNPDDPKAKQGVLHMHNMIAASFSITGWNRPKL